LTNEKYLKFNPVKSHFDFP